VQKKKASKKGSKATVSITYKCISGTCEVKPKKRITVNQGDTVDMYADNVDAHVVFQLASPFESGAGFPSTNPISIPKGTHHHPETVDSVSGTFSYSLKCTKPRCLSSLDNPEMVVP
jgi:hypothetical protein